ncbi:Sordarin/hypoxysordarin biosynthesis cluster protein P [Colletotrichum orbiculare MAFF 240422]|uniref:Sordarin/hypoxysordarin biosynthesis cluster protein P n=1 Tax=Colletotrichum orbiculare (strain 104-T / ATCC 96160 / CBS 514.97 / LARS 414 / MAFF 240422) TaxID=1213857 RepID=N4VAK4_COLOR|nr:Sordarin/hypoxysordarin biosynthesis cluster protein P [Colletotrichum orbiculare MAFF 240422]
MDAAGVLQQGRLLWKQHQTALEVAWTFSIYLPLVLVSYRRWSSRKIARYAGLPYGPVVAHILLATVFLVRYYGRYAAAAAAGSPLVPDLFDLVFGVVFCLNSLQVAAHVTHGIAPLARATFQVLAIQVLVATVAGYARADAGWFRAGAKLFDFTGVLVAAHAFCLWEGDYPAGVPLFIVLFAGLLAVNKWASRKLDGKPGPIPRVLAHCGFVTVQKKHRGEEEETSGDAEAEAEEQE